MTIFSRDMRILQREGEGGRAEGEPGGRRLQAERRANTKAGVGRGWDGGTRCEQGAQWPVWLRFREWKKGSGSQEANGAAPSRALQFAEGRCI